MNQYTYFILGILLGLAIGVYFFMDREEKIEKNIQNQQKIFSTKKLDAAMKSAVERITNNINVLKRELTEDEKDAIISQCCKEKFDLK